MTTSVNTTEDDLQFELLLCLASTIEVIQRLQQTGASETQGPEVFAPIRVKPTTERDDQEFELLLCLTYTIEAIQALLPSGAGGDGRFIERESEKVLEITRGNWQPRSHELALSPDSD